jgi:hypothetical protein
MRRIYIFALLFLIVIVNNVNSQVQFPFNSVFKYLKGSDAASLPGDWYFPDYDDSAWAEGDAPFRYGDGSGGTVLSDMQNNYSTVYLRSTFEVSNISNIKDISLIINWDDGFVIWINGEEALRQNAPSVLTYDAFAIQLHESGTPLYFTLDSSEVNLLEGENSLAVMGFNYNLSSSDFYFDINIDAQLNLPEYTDTIGISYDYTSGFYDNPFDLTLTSLDPEASIKYTLDGSNPQNSVTGFTGDSIVTINIDPASTTGRGTTPGVVVRASITKDGYKPSKPSGRTFIFLDNVRTQTYPGGNWPSTNINGQAIEYDMASDVVNDSRYTDLIDDALLEIPTISILTDLKNLFDPATGIYVNAEGRGIDWERECFAELINPDGAEGFQINAGLRLRGGASRNPSNPKHAFRLFFRGIYGEPQLLYPLFGDEGVEEFDKIDLRTAQNYAWSNDVSENEHNTFVRDIFSRDAQREMGQPYARGRYYHLYLNGLYFGLFQTQERTEARYAESYFGDDKEDYDVIKVSPTGWPYKIEVTDGNDDAWLEIYNMCLSGFDSNADYFKLEGKDYNGNPVKNSKVLVDIDNLIDYMVMIFYTGNYDAPVSTFGGNDMPNNFFAIYNRKDKGKGFVFCAHDSEHSLMIDPIYVGEGLYENRVNLADRKDLNKMEVNSFLDFHPQWLHYKLSNVKEYRVRFADRAARLFDEGGVLSPAVAAELFIKRAREIDTAIIAESARWGDAKTSPSRNKDDHWLPEINSVMNDYFPYRTNIVKQQLEQEDLYSNLSRPRIVKSDSAITDRDYCFSDNFEITVENHNSSGDIYYTLDGTDPRKIGGSVSKNALSSADDFNINVASSMILKARIKIDDVWSALRHVNFYSLNEDYTNLKVTELHYHPPDKIEGSDTISGQDFEFIEFKNTGTEAINISGLKLDSAVRFIVPENTIIAPGGFYVVASKPEEFYNIYGQVPSGNYSGHFSNSSEFVLLTDLEDNEILSFTYIDEYPWPLYADGEGHSIVSVHIDPDTDPNAPEYWRTSLFIGGSPFADDTIIISDVEDDVIFTNNETNNDYFIYPNPTSSYLNIRFYDLINLNDGCLQLFSNDGRIVYNSSSINGFMTIDLDGLNISSGVYFLRIVTDNISQIERVIYLDK